MDGSNLLPCPPQEQSEVWQLKHTALPALHTPGPELMLLSSFSLIFAQQWNTEPHGFKNSAPCQFFEPLFILHSEILLSFHFSSGRTWESWASWINGNDVTTTPWSCGQPSCSEEPRSTMRTQLSQHHRSLALGDGDGPGMVHSQELTRAPPHRCGMEQSLQALVPKEGDFTSWWKCCWKQ